MKVLVLLVVAIFGFTSGLNELSQDLKEFVDIAPVEKIKEILKKYSFDEEFVTVTNYIAFSQELKQLIAEADTVPEYLNVLNYFEDSGLEIYMYLNYLHEALGVKPLVPPSKISRRNMVSTRVSLKQVSDEIRGIMPKKEIAELHDSKMISSKAYKRFSDRIETDEYKTLIKNLNDNKVIQRVLQTLLERGIDIRDGIAFSFEMFGFRPYKLS